jgi:hypothetical protein
VLVAVTGILYYPALHGPFLFDDLAILNGLRENAREHPFHHFYRWLAQTDLRQWRNYVQSRPLTWLSYRLDFYYGGMNPRGFHATNIVLHMVAVVLVNHWTRTWLPDLQAALVAVLFAVHPLATSAVAYISGRASILCAVFMLGALLSAVSIVWPLAFVFGILALLAKEEAILLPILLGAVLWWR